MIRIENLSKSFPDGDLFNNVNIFLKRGMRAGLLGPNGSGKTTLFNSIVGTHPIDQGSIKNLSRIENLKEIKRLFLK